MSSKTPSLFNPSHNHPNTSESSTPTSLHSSLLHHPNYVNSSSSPSQAPLNGHKTNISSTACSCCPFGYHIEVDFVNYCEALLAALYSSQFDTNSSQSHPLSSKLHRHASITQTKTTNSLPHPVRRSKSFVHYNTQSSTKCDSIPKNNLDHNQNGHSLTHSNGANSFGSTSSGDVALQLFLNDFNYNNPKSAVMMSQIMKGDTHLLKMQQQQLSNNKPIYAETFHVDNSLGEAVARFEETLNESKKKSDANGSAIGNAIGNSNVRTSSATLPMRSHSHHAMTQFQLPHQPTYNQQHSIEFSPPASPAPSSTCTNTSSQYISKAVLSQIRDQMAMSLMRMRELETQVRDMPALRQKVILLREEKKKLMRKLNGEPSNDDWNNDAQSMSRVRELENSGLITPPVMRRKLVRKYDHCESDKEDDDQFDDLWIRTSPPPSKLISSKNIRLEKIANEQKEEMDKNNQQEEDYKQLSDAFNQTSLVSLNLTSVATNTEYENDLNLFKLSSSLLPAGLDSSALPFKPIMINSSTNTEEIEEDDFDEQERELTMNNEHNLQWENLGGISIQPEEVDDVSIPSPSFTSTPIPFNSPSPIPITTRSIGISTSLAPSLPRRSVCIGTDLLWDDMVSLKDLEMSKPAVVSWGTDPIRPDVSHSQCQVKPDTSNVYAGTDRIRMKDFGVSCVAKDLGIDFYTRGTQCERKYYHNKMIQVNHDDKCTKCELKQTETIGVGDCDVRGVEMREKQVSTERLVAEKPSSLDVSFGSNLSPTSRTSSAQSIRLCDKCNELITNFSREVCGRESPVRSPTRESKIPRPIHSTGSLERRMIRDKIIEESQNEILVYKNPAASSSSTVETKSLGSSPTKGNAFAPPLPPPRKKGYSKSTLRDIKAVDEIFKIISESEGESDESSSSGSSEEGTYDIETGAVAKIPASKRIKIEPTKEIKAALKVLNDSLMKPEKENKSALNKSLSIIEKEWFKIAAEKGSDPHAVEDYLDCFEQFSKHLLNRVVNLDDTSGNTAMHYAISHCNFDVVSVLLDSKVCDVNKQNKAGYTSTMLVSLSKVESETEKAVIRRLFQLGDVNVKAKQNGQTALMLAASHGQFTTCKVLLECGADPNLQDNDGSTALMCAAEHGHADVVRLLLSHPDCDPTILDNEGMTALKIAMLNENKDIGLMIYASSSMLSRGSSPYASLRRTQSKAIASALRRTGSFTYSQHPGMSARTFQLASSPPSRSRHSSTRSARN